MANVSSPLVRPIPELVDRLLRLSAGMAATEVAQAWGGVDGSYVAKLRSGYRPQRMDQDRRRRLEELLARWSSPKGGLSVDMVREAAPAGYGSSGEPQTFPEHVLMTAGRIAELAQQIATAAARQMEATRELGQRAVGEVRSPSLSAIEDGVRALKHVTVPKTKKKRA